MRFLLYLLWSAISMLVLSLVVVTVLLTVYQSELEERIVGGIERVTGRNIVIEDGFSFHFNPRPTFVANQVKMANSDWAAQPWMLEVEALQASLSLSHLLKGKVNLYSVEGINPKVLIEQDTESGKINWHFMSKRIPEPLKWLADNLSIEVAKISDAQVTIQVGQITHDLSLGQITGETDYFSKLIDIKALGQMDNKPLRLDIQLDNLRNMFLREPTKIDFDGLHGATQITGEGQIEDLFRWWGHDIQLGLVVPTLKEVQGWVTTYLIDTPKLRASARFVQPERWNSARFDDISVKSDALNGQTRIRGTVRQLRGMNGIKLQGELHYPLASLMEWKGLKSQTDTLIDAIVTLTGDKTKALAFDILSASLIGEGVDIRGQGGVKHLLQPTTEGIPFQGTVESVQKLGLINAKHWFHTDALNGGFEIKKRDGRLALEKVAVASFDGRAVLTGELQDITHTQLGTFELIADLQTEDVKTLNTLNEAKLPVFKETELRASINMQRSAFAARDVSLTLRSGGLSIVGSGDIPELSTLKIDAANVIMQAASITEINTQFATSFPELGQFKATGVLQGDIRNLYHINDINAILKNKYQIYSGSGKLRRLGPEMAAKLDIVADINSLTNIPPLLDSSLDVPDKVRGHGQATLTAKRFDDWSFTDIDVRFEGANQGQATGAVMHFPSATEYAFITDFERVSGSDLPELSMIETLKPENIRAYMHINRKPGEENFSLSHIDASFSLASGVATANIAGELSDLNHFKGLALQVGLSTSDVHAVPYLSELALKDGLRGNARLKLTGRPENLGISILNLQVMDTDLRGDLVLQNEPGHKPVLKGRLGSKNLDLLNLLHQEERTQLFSAEPLEFDWLNDLNANINIKAEHFDGLISQLDDMDMNISIHNGVLNMPNMHGTVGEGNMVGWLTIVAQRTPYNIIATLKAVNVKPEHINVFGDSGFIRDGEVDIDIGLGGTGNNIAEFMGNAYGKIQLQLNNSSLRHKNLKLFGADLISGVFDIIDTLSNKKSNYLPIECGVIHFPLVKGQAVASQGIAIKTDKTTVLGGGIIDFGSEELEIIIRPKARKGLGISAGTVANVVKISGTINQPKIAVDASSFIMSSATIGAAIVSGGWTLLAQGLLDRNKANSEVCVQTLAKPNAAFFKPVEQTIDTVDYQSER